MAGRSSLALTDPLLLKSRLLVMSFHLPAFLKKPSSLCFILYFRCNIVKYCLYHTIYLSSFTITNPHCQHKLFEMHCDRKKIKTSTNLIYAVFRFLDFCFIYFPHCLISHAFLCDFVAADSKKIHVCMSTNA